MGTEEVLSVDGMGVAFGSDVVLHDISFSVRRGELIALVGPNGSGKSVLLRALLGLVPHSGTVRWHGGIRPGYVPQKLSIEPDLPMNGFEFFSVKGVGHARALELSCSVGMDEQSLRVPLGHLSGGQVQRLLIAWALANEPNVLLFDEPTSGVDVRGQESVYDLLDRLRREHGLAVLLVSHDLNVVYMRADHVLCISRDLVCHGPPREVLDAATLQRLYGVPVGLYSHHEHHEH